MKALGSRRRHPAAIAILLLLGLVATGGLYSLLAPRPAQAAVATAGDVTAGTKLFLANCASCHGISGLGGTIGPSLAGVGAAAVDFQVGTGRMPPARPGVQASRSDQVKFTDQQIASLAAYVATLGPGPSIPDDQQTNGDGNIAHGNQLFKVNCAMCHNFAGSGGALTRGKYAPSLRNVTGKHIYEAMVERPPVDAGLQRQQPVPHGQERHHQLPARARQEQEPWRPEPGQPRAGVGGDVHLDLRPGSDDRCGRLAWFQGRLS